VERQGEGVPGSDGLLQQIRLPQEEFRVAIRRTAPCFIPQFNNGQTETAELCAPQPSEGSEDGDDGSVSEDENAPTPPFLIGEEKEDEAGLSDGKSIFINDVLENAERAVTRELPYNHPFIVQKNYIVAFVNKWDDPAQALFISTTTKLREITLRVVDSHFGDYTHGHLKQRVSAIVTTHLEQCSKETSKRIKFLLDVEKEPSAPTTHYFKDYRRKFLSFYIGLYHSNSNDQFIERLQGRMYQSTEFSRALENVMLNLRILGFRNVKPLELTILQASEDADEALRIMANVRAYFQVAFKRFVDSAVKAIDEELILGHAKGLHDALVTGLKLDLPDAHETCTRLVAESPHVAEKRNSLVASQRRLLLAQEELYNALY